MARRSRRGSWPTPAPPAPASSSTSPRSRSSPPNRATSPCCTRSSITTRATGRSTSPAPQAAPRTRGSSAAPSWCRSGWLSAWASVWCSTPRCGSITHSGRGRHRRHRCRHLAGQGRHRRHGADVGRTHRLRPTAARRPRPAHPACAPGSGDQVRGRLPLAVLALTGPQRLRQQRPLADPPDLRQLPAQRYPRSAVGLRDRTGRAPADHHGRRSAPQGGARCFHQAVRRPGHPSADADRAQLV